MESFAVLAITGYGEFLEITFSIYICALKTGAILSEAKLQSKRGALLTSLCVIKSSASY